MKAFLNTACLVLMAMVSLNTRSSATSCRTFADSQMTLSEQIANDLMQGVWTIDLPAAKGEKVRTIFQFRPAGKLDRLELEASGNYLRRHYTWQVIEEEEHPHLLLYNPDSGERFTFDLVQTCQGIELTNAKTGEQLSLEFSARTAARELNRLQESLVGEWANSFYPFELARSGNEQMAGAFLYYRFNADGAYSKSLGNSEAQIDETGQWEVSADGQYLMMHTEEYVGGRKVRKTSLARIKFIMHDEMVLEHSLKVAEASFCTLLKDFYFSKV